MASTRSSVTAESTMPDSALSSTGSDVQPNWPISASACHSGACACTATQTAAPCIPPCAAASMDVPTAAPSPMPAHACVAAITAAAACGVGSSVPMARSPSRSPNMRVSDWNIGELTMQLSTRSGVSTCTIVAPAPLPAEGPAAAVTAAKPPSAPAGTDKAQSTRGRWSSRPSSIACTALKSDSSGPSEVNSGGGTAGRQARSSSRSDISSGERPSTPPPPCAASRPSSASSCAKSSPSSTETNSCRAESHSGA
mmetsp:Transcript_5085/g.13179  ORF Transcript_5085/g.13179 Transcript_5085/m.13179 type:complete len:254 (+) Transcript_5085:385-1146(+)